MFFCIVVQLEANLVVYEKLVLHQSPEKTIFAGWTAH